MEDHTSLSHGANKKWNWQLRLVVFGLASGALSCQGCTRPHHTTGIVYVVRREEESQGQERESVDMRKNFHLVEADQCSKSVLESGWLEQKTRFLKRPIILHSRL